MGTIQLYMKITIINPSLSESQLNSSISIWFLPENRKFNGSCFTLFPAHRPLEKSLRFQLELEQNEEFLRESKAPREMTTDMVQPEFATNLGGCFFPRGSTWFPPNVEVFSRSPV